MYSSIATSQNGSAKLADECDISHVLEGNPHPENSTAFTAIALLTFIAIASCPFTILLNALVIVAVNTKPRLKTSSNILVGCLAVTDVFMGLFAQPMYIACRTLNLHGDTSDEYCTLLRLTRNIIRLLAASSIHHVFIMSFERYFAIKNVLTYTAMPNKTRKLLGASALAWIASIVEAVLQAFSIKVFITFTSISLSVILAVIIFCQVGVYSEARRHVKCIAAQQVSLEARKKFSKEKKALKLTSCVIAFLLLTFLPLFFVRILMYTSAITSVNVSNFSFNAITLVVILNSLINPIIYCVRLRQFRVAFVQILLRKNHPQAEQFEMRMVRFVSKNCTVKPEAGHQMENTRNSQGKQEINTGF